MTVPHCPGTVPLREWDSQVIEKQGFKSDFLPCLALQREKHFTRVMKSSVTLILSTVAFLLFCAGERDSSPEGRNPEFQKENGGTVDWSCQRPKATKL
jgi:hypothetical protein